MPHRILGTGTAREQSNRAVGPEPDVLDVRETRGASTRGNGRVNQFLDDRNGFLPGGQGIAGPQVCERDHGFTWSADIIQSRRRWIAAQGSGISSNQTATRTCILYRTGWPSLVAGRNFQLLMCARIMLSRMPASPAINRICSTAPDGSTTTS